MLIKFTPAKKRINNRELAKRTNNFPIEVEVDLKNN